MMTLTTWNFFPYSVNKIYLKAIIKGLHARGRQVYVCRACKDDIYAYIKICN